MVTKSGGKREKTVVEVKPKWHILKRYPEYSLWLGKVE
jgi:hypothetical protein